MSTALSYSSYDEAEDCLDPKDAVTRYQQEVAEDPNAIVVIHDLHCGEHYKVRTYRTKKQKEEYLRRTIQKIFDRVVSKMDQASTS